MLEKALLTGACIQDWNINSTTNLDSVNCSYIYLRNFQQERCPSYGNFTSGELSKLFQKNFETVELIFCNGIDWKGFSSAFKKVQVENEDTELNVESVEKKDGIIKIRVSIPTDANKSKIYSEFKHNYELALKPLEEKYKAELQAKDRKIEIYREKSVDMKKIIGLLASRAVDVKAVATSENIVTSKNDKNYDLSHAKIGGGFVGENHGNITTNNNKYEAKQKLAEAAADIQQILEQLFSTYPTSTPANKMVVVENALQNIESNPILKARLLAAVKTGSLNTLKEVIKHPLVNIVLSFLEALEE